MSEYEPLILTSVDELESLLNEASSSDSGFFILKHSHHCVISLGAKRRLLKHWEELPTYKLYEVNVIRSRDVSNAIEEKSQIRHESPQILFYSKGQWGNSYSHGKVDVGHAQKILKAAGLA